MKENVAYVGEVVNSEITEALKKNETVSAKVMDFPKTEYALLLEEQLKRDNRYGYAFMKRCFDIVVSLFAIILLLPVFLLVAVAIRIDSKGKPFLRQSRIGKNGKIIKIIKFRSMVHNAGEIFATFSREQKIEFEKNFKLDNDPRVTKVGAFIRKTSLDELPQLINILKGDLSLVGPRPVVEYEIYKYGGKAEKFSSVKPGLTGYWQVNGRSDTTYEERVEMDMFYIDNRSFSLDLKILIMTFGAVFKGKGAY